MPFAKGNQLAKGKHHSRRSNGPKTIWLLESLAQNGVDLQELLAKSILKAAKGDKQAMDLAHLLTKMLPLVAHAPKTEQGITQIDTLVINRFDAKTREVIAPDTTEPPSFDTTAVDESGAGLDSSVKKEPER